jgi:hypothetical protein
VAQQTYVGSDSPLYAGDERGEGWLTFAGVMLMVVAVLNIIDGIAAISSSRFFISGAKFVISDLKTWGWVVLVLGVVQILIAFGIWSRNQLARWAGILIVALNAIAQLLMMPSYPFWSLTIFAVDVLILYGLAAYGGKLRA